MEYIKIKEYGVADLTVKVKTYGSADKNICIKNSRKKIFLKIFMLLNNY